jgi:Predicted transcriptional regulator
MNNNEKIIEIIKNRRLSLSLSLSEVARRMGIPKSTLSRYESLQRQFPLDQISAIALVLGLQPEDILGLGSQNVEENQEPSILSEINKVSSQLEVPRQKVVLETASSQLKEQQENIIELKEWTYNYYDNAVSAGTGEYLTDGRQETITLPVDYDADFVVPVNGDSMEPEYHHYDYVFVETTYDLSDGDIGVFILDGDAYIKELRIDDEGAFLHSLNPKYRDKPILQESDFRIVGKVVGRYNENDKKED